MRFFRIIKYLAGFTIPFSAFLSVYFGGAWAFLTPVYAFILVAGIEVMLPVNSKNLSLMEEEMAKKDFLYDILLYLNVPVQYGILYFFLSDIYGGDNSWWELTGKTITMGICCGVIGINVAHELGHRKSKFEQILSKTLLLSSLYMHYIIEHNKGHHKRVSTDEDPASSRLNESIYHFFPRTLFGSIRSAWQIELKELSQKNKKTFSVHNEMLLFALIEILFLLLIYLKFGLLSLILFTIAALLGILLLESVNYIEHYGLRRRKLPSGNYERVQPWHSWNSDHILGRVMLYELTRHSDHHYLASRKYQVLRHLDEAPQLPAGYPAMIILSLLPQVFFKIMNPRVNKIMAQHEITE